MRRYQIQVELDECFEPDDVRLDLRTNRLHPLHEHDVHIAVGHCGSAVLGLSCTAVDLWSAILAAMALLRQSGYVPTAVEARRMTGLIDPHGQKRDTRYTGASLPQSLDGSSS